LHGIDRDSFYRYKSEKPSWYYEVVAPGFKYNMTDIAASLGIHQLKKATNKLRENQKIQGKLDWKRRLALMRNHTATHLLHRVLRQVLGEGVKQSGSLVSPDRLRFDYTVDRAPTDEELAMIEKLINEKIRENLNVVTQIMGFEEAKDLGAVALFDEKYGDKVRVLMIGEFSKELCGGTHVDKTGVIELFKIISDEAISAGVRRIEAVSGPRVIEYILSLQEDLRRENTELLCKLKDLEYKKERLGGAPLVDFEIFEITAEEINIIKKALRDKGLESLAKFIEHLEERNGRLKDRIANIEKEIKRLLRQKADEEIESLILNAKESKGVKYVLSGLKDYDMETLRIITDNIRSRLKSCIILLASKIDARLIFVCVVTDDHIKKGFNAGELVKAAAKTAQGGGGGRAGIAEAGGKDPSKLDEALKKANMGPDVADRMRIEVLERVNVVQEQTKPKPQEKPISPKSSPVNPTASRPTFSTKTDNYYPKASRASSTSPVTAWPRAI